MVQTFYVARYNDMPAAWFWNRMFKAVTDNKSDIFPCPSDCKESTLGEASTARTIDAIPKPLVKILQCVGIRKKKVKAAETKDRVRLKKILRHRAVCKCCEPHKQCPLAIKLAQGTSHAEHNSCMCGESMSCPHRPTEKTGADGTATSGSDHTAMAEPATLAACGDNQPENSLVQMVQSQQQQENMAVPPLNQLQSLDNGQLQSAEESGGELSRLNTHADAQLSSSADETKPHVQSPSSPVRVASNSAASAEASMRTSLLNTDPLFGADDGPKGLLPPDLLFDPNACKKFFGPNANPRCQPQLVNLTHPGATFMMPEAHFGNQDLQLLGGKYAYYIPYASNQSVDGTHICQRLTELERKEKQCCHQSEHKSVTSAAASEHAPAESTCCDVSSSAAVENNSASFKQHAQQAMSPAASADDGGDDNDDDAAMEMKPLLSTMVDSGIGRSVQSSSDASRSDVAQDDESAVANHSENISSSSKQTLPIVVATKNTCASGFDPRTNYASERHDSDDADEAREDSCDSGILESEFIKATKEDTGYDVTNPFRKPTKEEWQRNAMTKRMNEISGQEMQALRMHQIYMEEMRKHHLKAVTLAYQQCQKELQQQPLQAVPQ